MFRLFLLMFLISSLIWAENPYYVAVCGVSRSTEELEIALEFSDDILVKKCDDKKLNAWIKVTQTHIEAYGDQGVILSQKRQGIVVDENQANRFIKILLQRLSVKPEKAKPEPPKVEIAKTEEFKIETLPILDFEPDSDDFKKEDLKWRIESLASLDQWNHQISTKIYPGAQLNAQVQFLDNWEIGTKTAFGTSAFQIGDQKIWNQQVFFTLSAGKKFDLTHGFSMMPKAGYLYWGSFSGLEDIPKFQRHDIELGGEAIYGLFKPSIEMRLLFSVLPINLGLQSSFVTRYYFVPNWFVTLQSSIVASFAHGPASTFLSASLGLGVVLAN